MQIRRKEGEGREGHRSFPFSARQRGRKQQEGKGGGGGREEEKKGRVSGDDLFTTVPHTEVSVFPAHAAGGDGSAGGKRGREGGQGISVFLSTNSSPRVEAGKKWGIGKGRKGEKRVFAYFSLHLLCRRNREEN